jgi:hypothetical protein
MYINMEKKSRKCITDSNEIPTTNQKWPFVNGITMQKWGFVSAIFWY